MTDPNELIPVHRLELPVSYGLDELLQHNLEAAEQQRLAERQGIFRRIGRGMVHIVQTGFEALADEPMPQTVDAESALIAEGYTNSQPPAGLVSFTESNMRRAWWKKVRAGVARPMHEVRDSLKPLHPPIHNAVWFESGNSEHLVEFEQAKPKAGWLQRLVDRIPSPIGPESRG